MKFSGWSVYEPFITIRSERAKEKMKKLAGDEFRLTRASLEE